MVEETKIGSWEDFIARIFKKRDGGNWHFRGLSSAQHELKPKIGRNELVGGYDLRSEQHAIREFKLRALPYLDFQPSTELEWLTLAQHHGLPTRLMDWSLSPLVATFFAVAGRDQGETCCVYGIRCDSVVESVGDPYKIEEVSFYRPAHISPRISAQHAAFSVHPEPGKAFDHDRLVKFLIPAGLRLTFTRTLDFFGINRATLFPSLDGLSDHIAAGIQHWNWDNPVVL